MQLEKKDVYAARIKDLRTRHHMTQNQFAAALGVSESTVRMWELGKSRAQNPTLARIMDLYGVSLDWLYGNAAPPGEETGQGNAPESRETYASPRFFDSRVLREAVSGDDLPFGRDRLPVLTVAPEGLCAWRPQDVTEWELAPDNLIRKEDNIGAYYFLRVPDEAMYPVMLPGDLALVRCQERAESGAVVVARIDGGPPRLARLRFAGLSAGAPAPAWVEVSWDNPHFPPRRFEGEEVRRVRVLGRVLRVMRDM